MKKKESLKKRILRLNESQGQGGITALAANLLVTPATVYSWLAGKSEPKGNNLNALERLEYLAAKKVQFRANGAEEIYKYVDSGYKLIELKKEPLSAIFERLETDVERNFNKKRRGKDAK